MTLLPVEQVKLLIFYNHESTITNRIKTKENKIMNITFVGEVTSIIKASDEKYKSGITWKKSTDKWSSEETVYVNQRLEIGQRVFVNFRTEEEQESENIPENSYQPQPVDTLGLIATVDRVLNNGE